MASNLLFRGGIAGDLLNLKEAAGVCGRCGLIAMGNSIFSFLCKLLVLRYLENEHAREPQFAALRRA